MMFRVTVSIFIIVTASIISVMPILIIGKPSVRIRRGIVSIDPYCLLRLVPRLVLLCPTCLLDY